MRKIVFGTFALACLMAAGCGTGKSEILYWHETFHALAVQDTNSVQSPADRMHTQKQVAIQDARSIVDDFDFILMRERPSRLSRWHNR